MDTDVTAARMVFERWGRMPGLRQRPVALAQATWILQDTGAVPVEDVLPVYRPFVIAALDFRKGGAWDPEPWKQALHEARGEGLLMALHPGTSGAQPDGRAGASAALVPEPDQRPRVAWFCEPLLARLDPRQAWDAMRAVVPEAELVSFGGLGLFLAVQWRLRNPGDDWIAHLTEPAFPPLLKAIAAYRMSMDAVSPEPAIREALHRRLLQISRKMRQGGLYLGQHEEYAYLTALSILDPGEAFTQIRDRMMSWPDDASAADAMYFMARWLAGEARVDGFLDELKAEGAVASACEWISALARARAASPETLERVALYFVEHTPEWLEPQAWEEAIMPLCEAAANLGTVSVVEALCEHLEPPVSLLVYGLLAADLSRLRQRFPEMTHAFLAGLAASPTLARMPWDPEGDAPLSSLEEGLAALRVAAASPVGLDVWEPLSDVLAIAEQGGARGLQEEV